MPPRSALRCGWLIACTWAASAAVATPAESQRRLQVGVRARLRIVDTPHNEIRTIVRGQVSRLTVDTVVLSVPFTLNDLAFPISRVGSAEVSIGTWSRRKSALVNGAIGAGLGAAYMAYGWLPAGFRTGRQSERAAVGAVVGGLASGVVGALRPPERWRKVELGRPGG